MKKKTIGLLLLLTLMPTTLSPITAAATDTVAETTSSTMSDTQISNDFTSTEEELSELPDEEAALNEVAENSSIEATAETTTASDVTLPQAEVSNNGFSKEAVLAAGYSEEQYIAMTQIPYIEAVPLAIQSRSTTLTSEQTKLVTEAKKHIGVPYVWGGTSTSGFDCSGLVQYVYDKALGIQLARVTYDQEKQGREVSLNALQAGDLLFYGTRGSTYHVGMYIGNGQMIHAPEPGDVVKIINVSSLKPSFARRIIADAPQYPTQSISIKVTVTKANWNLWKTFFTESLGLTTLGTVYDAKSIVTVNSDKYYELYKKGVFAGYLNVNGARELVAESYGEYVSAAKPNYSIWKNFDWSEKLGTTDGYADGLVYRANYIYTLGDGNKYYSLYQGSVWKGYVNANAMVVANAVKTDKLVTAVKSNYTIWGDFYWSAKNGNTSNAADGLVYRAMYQYTLGNGRTYYSLYQGDTWIGYINTDAVQDLKAQTINKNYKITKTNYTIWGNFYWNSKKDHTSNYPNKILTAKYKYVLGNGVAYYSLYNGTTWVGYVNANAGTLQ